MSSRGSALFNTKVPEVTAEDVINHLGEDCRVRATARLVNVCQETVARLIRVAGRHAEGLQDQHVFESDTVSPMDELALGGYVSRKPESVGTLDVHLI